MTAITARKDMFIYDTLYLIIKYAKTQNRDHIGRKILRRSSGNRGTRRTRCDYHARSKQPVNSSCCLHGNDGMLQVHAFVVVKTKVTTRLRQNVIFNITLRVVIHVLN